MKQSAKENIDALIKECKEKKISTHNIGVCDHCKKLVHWRISFSEHPELHDGDLCHSCFYKMKEEYGEW